MKIALVSAMMVAGWATVHASEVGLDTQRKRLGSVAPFTATVKYYDGRVVPPARVVVDGGFNPYKEAIIKSAEAGHEGRCRQNGGVVLGNPSTGFDNILLDSLRVGRQFAWYRLGDGELQCLGTQRSINVAGAQCDLGTRDALISSLGNVSDWADHNLFAVIGTWWLCESRDWTKSLKQLMRTRFKNSFHRRPNGGVSFALTDHFYVPIGSTDDPSAEGFVQASANRAAVIVGPAHLQKLGEYNTMFNVVAFIQTPNAGGSYTHVPSLVTSMLSVQEKHGQGLIFLVAFGVPGKLVVIHGYAAMPNCTFVDVGASLDGYVGVQSRDYNRDRGRFCKSWSSWMIPGLCSNEGRRKTIRRVVNGSTPSSHSEIIKMPQLKPMLHTTLPPQLPMEQLRERDENQGSNQQIQQQQQQQQQQQHQQQQQQQQQRVDKGSLTLQQSLYLPMVLIFFIGLASGVVVGRSRLCIRRANRGVPKWTNLL
ncbi:hypothetical protein DIPPA_03918 [Diplonema papillatum]|nr:hypothetical protein DIPPA_03918 [Diplonema papillatum]